MPTLLMRLGVSLDLEVNEHSPDAIREFGGRRIRKISPADSGVIFYDWSFDSSDLPVAFEVHLETTDLVFRGPHSIRSLNYVTFNPFPVIWLTESRMGIPAGMEAWGGLDFFRDDDGTLVMAVETEVTLTDQQLSELLKSHHLERNR